MMNSNAYLMEHGQESTRLERKTDATRDQRQLELVGIKPGMKVLDAAGATGAVARTIAKLVGPHGQVTVMDRSEDRLQFGESLARSAQLENISFVCHDIMGEPFARDHFDAVWCRFAFEYLSAPAEALLNLAKYVRVGGKVIIGDLDGNGVTQYPTNPIVEDGLARVLRSVAGLFDPFVGRKLVSYFHAAGLHIDAVHVLPYHVYAGHIPEADIENWTRKLDQLRSRCVAQFDSQAEYDRFASEFLNHMKTPGVFMYSTLILVEGTRTD
jgi:ubiquinone/menaquinone biosynthesis C-methylase UbiE